MSLEDDFDALRFGLPRNPALAHRLDRETAGCLVLGRHHKALEKLGLLFKQGKVTKTYWAVVDGRARRRGGRDRPAARPARRTRGWWMKVDPNGPAGADALAGPRAGLVARRAGRLARTRAEDRPDAPAARPLRGRRAGRSSATRSTAAAPTSRCSFSPARSSCRCRRPRPPVEVEAPVPPHMLAALAACGLAADGTRLSEHEPS